MFIAMRSPSDGGRIAAQRIQPSRRAESKSDMSRRFTRILEDGIMKNSLGSTVSELPGMASSAQRRSIRMPEANVERGG
jgi:hypothetical protein